jgi:hypothetical protein
MKRYTSAFSHLMKNCLVVLLRAGIAEVWYRDSRSALNSCSGVGGDPLA